MSEQGSGGNVIAALASFVVAGLGQLVQGRLIAAAIHFVLAGAVWAVSLGTMGWVVHIYSAYNAATWSK
jgi:TM2 domain-containing membrane protein YozV